MSRPMITIDYGNNEYKNPRGGATSMQPGKHGTNSLTHRGFLFDLLIQIFGGLKSNSNYKKIR